jgi:hypothetical protein
VADTTVVVVVFVCASAADAGAAITSAIRLVVTSAQRLCGKDTDGTPG